MDLSSPAIFTITVLFFGIPTLVGFLILRALCRSARKFLLEYASARAGQSHENSSHE